MTNQVIADINSLTVLEKNPIPKGKGSRSCRACMSRRGLIRKYDMMICRRCFREYAEDIGFEKMS
ncbi:small subunit ribosomal protein S29e [Nematocida major]|uniref:small subunit ribosomal protein S29e n=1 Tax=Nematocida major TaxID=1912982 RepID=UPI0020079A08|nr:small subunit ribosomal protein S29e [Nematocida major]KAH9386946.1 small subunit ribosomal protein S29e [Nematocida major]